MQHSNKVAAVVDMHKDTINTLRIRPRQFQSGSSVHSKPKICKKGKQTTLKVYYLKIFKPESRIKNQGFWLKRHPELVSGSHRPCDSETSSE
ncbi:MAG: hypothetical protein WC197_04455 [Candidatus Gastranaerophilaceae bacterium]|jgi:hypothetical protein